jgi:hypothetical protein
MHQFASFWKTIFWEGWVGGEALDTLATAFSLSRVGMYA